MTMSYRVTVASAAHRMLEEAKDRARQLPFDDPDRRFYSGVETAALHALHPAAQAVRSDDRSWLCSESGSFQDGYIKATTVLSVADVMADGALRVPLPEP